uniref:Uncharacterized protein n=1 Tax=Brassica campestris TaxID=3711 RepID=A0A3P5XXL6_BRACM|nr:unnamed protein product [Brassica rapa]
MTKRRFDKVKHFDKDSGSDSSCFSSEEAEESEEEVSEEGDESPTDVDDDEPPEEEEEHYILGCRIKCQPGYECKYCPFITCLNERTMRAHVSSRVITSSYVVLFRLMDVEKMVFDLVYSRDEYEPIHSLPQRPNDEQSLYFGAGEEMFNVWDLRAGKSVFNWKLHKYMIHTIDFNPQNPHLMATSSQDRTACLWDLRTMGAKKPKALATIDYAKAVYSAYFSPSGLSLATTSRDNYIGVLSGANFEDTSMIYHCNNTVRKISSFRYASASWRGVWGWDDSNIFVGNVAKGIGVSQTKGIDVISTKLKRTVKKLQSPLVKDVISRLHCHPLNVGMLAGSTAGGHVYVWTTK